MKKITMMDKRARRKKAVRAIQVYLVEILTIFSVTSRFRQKLVFLEIIIKINRWKSPAKRKLAQYLTLCLQTLNKTKVKKAFYSLIYSQMIPNPRLLYLITIQMLAILPYLEGIWKPVKPKLKTTRTIMNKKETANNYKNNKRWS